MVVLLSHPWRWHHIGDVLDTAAGDLTAEQASQLIRAGLAQPLERRLTDRGGGWLDVRTISGRTVRVRGRAEAIRLLRAEAVQ